MARPFSIPSVFALFRPPVDGKFDYLSREEYRSTAVNPLTVASSDAYCEPAPACPQRLWSEPGRLGVPSDQFVISPAYHARLTIGWLIPRIACLELGRFGR